MMGTGLCTMVRATCSSLKAHRSSIEPPPRTSKITSTSGTPGSPLRAAKSYSCCKARVIEAGASAPCTSDGAINTGICGTRRRKAVATSCSAAAPSDVTTPIPRGMTGNGRLRLASNSPSASSCALSRKNCSNHAPWPARCRLSTMSCKSPRCSYTPNLPRTSTSSPSRGVKSIAMAARRNMAQRSCPAVSLILK